jgi:hypothetical protein
VQRTTRITGWLKGSLRAAAAALAVSLIAGCGGGGSSNDSQASSPSSPAPSGSNQMAVVVNQGVSSVPNIPTVTVTVCAPGSTSACQTIDNVLLDTKSFGLRVVNTSLSSIISGLPTLPSGSGNLAQCAIFANSLTWGTIRTADVHIAGETATSIPVQVVGDLPDATIPSDNCTDRVPVSNAQQTASALNANGILGIGVAVNDCGSQCAQPISTPNNPSTYFSCPPNATTASCTRVSVPTSQQVANPIARFPTDNNGVIVQFPAVPDGGSKTATGLVIFGINTQADNAMPSSVTVLASDQAGDLRSSTFNGNTVDAFLDTGSNGLFFSASVPACGSNAPDFYCPTSKQTFSATLLGVGATASTVSFSADNANNLFNSSNFALSNLAGGQNVDPRTLDLGLPFYFGRTVYHGLDLSATGGQTPFIAF